MTTAARKLKARYVRSSSGEGSAMKLLEGFQGAMKLQCHNKDGSLNPVYVKDVATRRLRKNEFWLIATETGPTRSGKPIVRGAIKAIIRANEIYIDLICSKDRAGRFMFEELKKEAKRLGKRAITLSSVPTARGAYERWGFKYTKNNLGRVLVEDGLYPMRRSGTRSKTGSTSTRRTKKTTGTRRQVPKSWFSGLMGVMKRITR